MIKEWDADEEAEDAKMYQTREDGLKTLIHIIKKYIGTKEDKKIKPSKQTAKEVLDLFFYTLLFDKEFHQFALDNYRVLIEYDKKKNVLDIMKLKY